MIWSRSIRVNERSRFREIEARIEAAESASDAEIVPVVVVESHDYAFYEFRVAILLGLLTFLACLVWIHPLENLLQSNLWGYQAYHLVLATGLLAFGVMLVVYLLVNIPWLDRQVIPGRVMAQRVRERALRAFAESKVSHTEKRLGLLIFVSLLERRVEILADTGLSGKIAPEIWQQIVSDMGRIMHQAGWVDGVLHGVEQAGQVLAVHFPASGSRSNRLADEVTLMER
jgi:putative membrane protein